MSVDASFSIQPKTGGGGYFNLVVEQRDLTNSSGMPIMARLVGGLEYSFRGRFFLRAGYGSGYPSAGLGLEQPKSAFAFTWYSEELGSGYHAERDARFLLQFQVRTF